MKFTSKIKDTCKGLFAIDYRTLGMFRMLMASIVIIDICLRCRDFEAFLQNKELYHGILQSTGFLAMRPFLSTLLTVVLFLQPSWFVLPFCPQFFCWLDIKQN